MATISAKKIQGALAKAKDVGVVEEPCTIGEFTFVLRNLRPDQYTAIYEENKEKESIDGLYSFQKSHICRSIIEVNGVDLREADFVEVEEEVKDPRTGEPVLEPTGDPKVKKIRLERHEYVRRYILDTWTKEPLQVAWRKFNDVLKLSEDKSKEGVKFVLPEMTSEEKLREAIGNAREVIDEVPERLVDTILEEAGLMRISTADEVKRALEAADKLARAQAAEAQPTEAATEAQAPNTPSIQQPIQVQQPTQQPLVGAPPTGPRVRQPTPEEIMARRTPLNQQSVALPSTSPTTVVATPQARPAAPQAPPQPSQHVPGQDVLQAAVRSQHIARMEAESLDMDIPLPPPGDPSMTMRHVTPQVQAGQPGHPQITGQVGPHAPNAPHLQTAPPGVVPNARGPLLSQKGREKVDMQAFGQIVDRPPTAGINPRFRAPR